MLGLDRGIQEFNVPILLGNRLVNTVGDVNSRVRSLMNDDNAQLYPDNSTQLLNSVRDAYTWMFGQVQKMQGGNFEKVTIDIPYIAGTSGEEQDIGQLLPFDIYWPIKLEFRLNSSETYQDIDRKQVLSSRNGETLQRPPEWVWRGNSIVLTSGNQNGLLKITYRSLGQQFSLTTDAISNLIPNCLEALAHYAAHELAGRRGQWVLKAQLLGDDGSKNGGVGFGAKFFASLVLDILIMDEQAVPRRGGAFSEAAIDTISNRQFNG